MPREVPVPGQRWPAPTPMRITTGAALCTVASVLPGFLLGSLAILIRAELGFDEARLGLAAACFFLTSALAALPAGRLAERIGSQRALRYGALCSAAALLGLAVLARSWSHVALLMALAGIANGTAQTSSTLAIARGLPAAHQGIAMGVKQSAMPAASLIAGFVVPLIGLTVGWRWAFAGALVLALALAVAIPRDGPAGARGAQSEPPADTPIRLLLLLALAAGCGTSAAAAMATFLVESAVRVGAGVGPAGLLLAFGGFVGVSVRLVGGWLADRGVIEPYPSVMWMLAAGAVGYGFLAWAGSWPALLVGTSLAFGGGWGWTGIFNLGLVRRNTGATGSAAGITQTGMALGAAAGPMAFGALAASQSFRLAWAIAGAAAVTAAVLMKWALRRDHER